MFNLQHQHEVKMKRRKETKRPLRQLMVSQTFYWFYSMVCFWVGAEQDVSLAYFPNAVWLSVV